MSISCISSKQGVLINGGMENLKIMYLKEMLGNEYKQAKAKQELQKLTVLTSNVRYYQYKQLKKKKYLE